MGSNLYSCPQQEFLPDMPEDLCPVRFDQIQRLIFCRLTGTPFTTTNILLEASWTPRMTAEDDTKLIGTPKFAGLVLPKSDPIKTGGNDNTTIDGVPILEGAPFASITDLAIRNASEATIAVLDSLTGETAQQAGQTNVGFYAVNRFNEIMYTKSGSNALLVPIYNFFVTDVSSEGFNKDNVHWISFDLAPRWSRGLEMKKITAFNALTIKNS